MDTTKTVPKTSVPNLPPKSAAPAVGKLPLPSAPPMDPDYYVREDRMW